MSGQGGRLSYSGVNGIRACRSLEAGRKVTRPTFAGQNDLKKKWKIVASGELRRR